MSFACPDCHAPLERPAPCCGACGRATRWEGALLDVSRSRPGGFPQARLEHLAALDDRHFWFPGRRALLVALVRRHAPPGSRFLELGCGSGALLQALVPAGLRLAAVDGHPEGLRRIACAEVAVADVARTPFAAASFEAVGAFDVLEHAEDDGAVLREAARVLRPGGTLIVSVPAFPSLWSDFDVRAGHRRRYSRAGLHRALGAEGFQPVFTTAYGFTLFPLFALSRWVGRGRREWGLPPRVLNRALTALCLAEARLAARWPLPWGSSWVCAARKVA